jgi:hypothetical protein
MGAVRRFQPVSQGEFFPTGGRLFGPGEDPETVTVADASEVARDNLVALDIDPRVRDPDRELEVRFAGGLGVPDAPVLCSRVPGGTVASSAGVVFTPQGTWLRESLGELVPAKLVLPVTGKGEVELAVEREVDEDVAVVCREIRRHKQASRTAAKIENYGHWTFEVLTRVAALLRAGLPDGVRLLVPQSLRAFQRESIAMLGVAEERLFPWDGQPTRFRSVYLPSALPAGWRLGPAAVELLRGLAGRFREDSPRRRLFVTRRGLDRNRRFANEDELWAVARNLGFDEVLPETLPSREQMKLFAEAEAIAGIHGSGLVNAIYMAPGTGFCEVAPAGFRRGKVPNMWNMAASGRQPYGISIGPRRLDPTRFERVLADVIYAATARADARLIHA